MLKKLKNDNSGSALLIAVLVLLVVFLLSMSFVSSVATSTRIDSSAISADEAYLVAKSGLTLFEEGKTDAELADFAGDKIKGEIEGKPEAWFEIEVIKEDGKPVNIKSTGHYNDAAYMLYRYVKAEDNTPPPPENPEASPTDKAANKQYSNTSGGQFNAPVKDGPSIYLGTENIAIQNLGGGTSDNILALGDISVCSSSGSGTVNNVFTRGKFRLGHGSKVRAEVYAKAIDIEDGSATTIGGKTYVTDFLSLTSNDGWTFEDDVKIGGSELYNGFALNITANGANFKKNVYVNGDVLLQAQNGVNIGGDLYVNGNVVTGNNNKLNITGNIYYTGQCSIPGAIKISEETFKQFAGEDFVSEIEKVLDANLPKSDKPITQLPPDGEYNNTTYHNLGEIETKFYDASTGITTYIINKSCTIDFDVYNSLINCTDNSKKKLVLDADNKKVDIFFKNNSNTNLAYNHWGNGIEVFDHNHTGLIRIFLDTDVKMAMDKPNNYWRFIPINSHGKEDATYVPNFYVFSLANTVGGVPEVKEMSPFQDKNCFSGFWLTPNVKIGTLNNNSTYKDGDITFDRAPFAHGMVITDSLAFQPGAGYAIVYYDPDWDRRNKWSYSKSIEDVYKAP